MAHPLIEQFCRIPGYAACQPHFFNRMQRELHDDVQPKLDERERLLVENAELKEQLRALEARVQSQNDQAEHQDGTAGGPTPRTGGRHRALKSVRPEENEPVTS